MVGIFAAVAFFIPHPIVRSVDEVFRNDVLRIIANNREWMRSYQVKLSLATNPKCPQGTAIKYLNYLQDRDLKNVMKSKDVPSAVASHARRILTKKGKI